MWILEGRGGVKASWINGAHSQIVCSVDQVSFIGVGWRKLIRHHVLAIQPTLQRRQRASLLEHCREQALRRRPGGAAAGAVPGRDQRQPARGVVSVRSKPSTKGPSGQRSSRCFLPIAWFPTMPRRMACRCGWTRWSCIGRGNGARAGWRAILYEQLGLDRFWAERLPDSREGTCWQHVLQTLVCYRLIDPGSEWRLHRQWFEQSAMETCWEPIMGCWRRTQLYRCLDKLLPHKQALFRICASGGRIDPGSVRGVALRSDEQLFRVASAG